MQNAGIRGSGIRNQSSQKKMKKSERRAGMPDSSFFILHSAFALRFNPVYAGFCFSTLPCPEGQDGYAEPVSIPSMRGFVFLPLRG